MWAGGSRVAESVVESVRSSMRRPQLNLDAPIQVRGGEMEFDQRQDTKIG